MTDALRAVVASGWTDEAKRFAAGALAALSRTPAAATATGSHREAKHVMISCECTTHTLA